MKKMIKYSLISEIDFKIILWRHQILSWSYNKNLPLTFDFLKENYKPTLKIENMSLSISEVVNASWDVLYFL